MPRSQKGKLQASEKRRQAQAEAQAGENAQATAAVEKESTPSFPPQYEDTAQILPPVRASSTSQWYRRAQATTFTSVGASWARSDAEYNNQDYDRANAYEAAYYTENVGEDSLTRKPGLLEQFLLYKYKMKQPILKEDMLKIIGHHYEDQFPEILKKASERIEIVFAVDLKEIDSTRQSYDLISKLKLPNNGRVRAGRGLPKTGLLMNILGMIFMKGNCAAEEDIWKFLGMMRVYAGRKHFIYGEPRKLITKDLVRLQYLEYRQVSNSDPPRYEFLWGPKAQAETSKMQVLEFLAKVNDTIPSAFPSYYEEALRDEEERTQARASAIAKVIASSRAMPRNIFPPLVKPEFCYYLDKKI
ncbi:melanoma-associated antigen B5-like [Lycaon pictus]